MGVPLLLVLGAACGDGGLRKVPVGPDTTGGTFARAVWRVRVTPGFTGPGVDDSTVYFASANHEIVAVRKGNGSIRWTSQSIGNGFPIGTALAVAGGVVLYPETNIYAFNVSDGQLKWTYRDSSGSAGGFFRLTTNGGTIFGGSNVGLVVAVDLSTGALRWRRKISTFAGQVIVFAPVVSGGLLYVTYRNVDVLSSGAVVAMDTTTGAEVWRQNLPGTSAALGGGGMLEGLAVSANRVIVSSYDGQLRGFSADSGVLVWTVPIPGGLGGNGSDTRPIALANGILVAGSILDLLVGLDPQSGAELWRLVGQHVGVSLTSPIVSSGDSFLLQFDGEVARVFAATGATVWRTTAPPEPSLAFGSPTSDSLFVYAAGDSGVYALRR